MPKHVREYEKSPIKNQYMNLFYQDLDKNQVDVQNQMIELNMKPN